MLRYPNPIMKKQWFTPKKPDFPTDKRSINKIITSKIGSIITLKGKNFMVDGRLKKQAMFIKNITRPRPTEYPDDDWDEYPEDIEEYEPWR